MHRAMIAVIAVVGLVGCTDLPARIRQHTYPPQFRYISQQQLQSAMWRLARDVHELDRILRVAPEAAPPEKERTLELLAAIDETAAELDVGGWPSNHPLIDANMSTFRRDVAAAREAVLRQPPGYYLAGSLAGACLYCHSEPR